MRQSRLQLLQEMPIFGGVQAQTLDFILDNARIVCVRENQFFFHEDELAASMYVLEEGRVEVVKTWQDHLYSLNHLDPGDCFGEMALMGFKPRSASIVATEDCSAIEITTDLFAELYDVYPQQFTIIQMNMGREVCRRLSEADNRLFIGDMEKQKYNHLVEKHTEYRSQKSV